MEGKIFVQLNERAKQLTVTLQKLNIHQQKDLYLRERAEQLVRVLRKPNLTATIKDFLLKNNTDKPEVISEFLKNSRLKAQNAAGVA